MSSGNTIFVHADEACLGNGREPPCPGGAGGLVEIWKDGAPHRRDYFVSEPDTTNNRMAIRSAIEAIRLLATRGRPLAIDFTSDSEYLVKGMSQWMRAWKRRDWRNVKNVELWQALEEVAEPHDIRWRWVRGHAGHPRNEYANELATRAAKEQRSSEGLVDSGFLEWLEGQRKKKKYLGYDPERPLDQ